jgi:hypothetical protein
MGVRNLVTATIESGHQGFDQHHAEAIAFGHPRKRRL